MFEIIFYETKKGERPAEDFIFSLQPKMQAKIIGMMHVLEENGNLVREPIANTLMTESLNCAAKLEVIFHV
mgnify:CR=1 FL=1